MKGTISSVILLLLVGQSYGWTIGRHIRMDCPFPEETPTFYPDPTDCTKYFICSQGIPVHMDCPSVLHWNKQLNVCDNPLDAGCDLSESLSRIEIRDEMTCPSEEEIPTYFPDPHDCNKYYECSNGEPVHMECPPTLHWNKEKNICDTHENAKCVPQLLRNLLDEMICPLEEETPTFYPDPTDCTKYFICSQGIPVHMDCPSVLHWNKQLNVCDNPLDAGCDLSETVSRIEAWDEMICPFPEETPTYYPDPHDCNKYYECSNGEPVHMECPPTLHWNKEKNSCDTHENAKCVPQLLFPYFY